MTEGDWTNEARQKLREFLATATPEEIRAFKEEIGYDVYSKGPSVREALFATSDRIVNETDTESTGEAT